MRRWTTWSGLAIAALAGACAGGDDAGGDAGEDAPGLANVWVDANGGSCTVSETPIVYEGVGDDGSCDSFDAAWDAMADGQTAGVVPGTYGPQVITGDKTAETKIVGHSSADTVITGTAECFDPPEFGSASALCAMGAHLTLEHMRLDSGDGESNSSSAARPHGEHVTFRDVDVVGEFPNVYVSGASFTWRGGSHGEDDVVPPPRRCDRSYGMPLWVVAPDVTIDGVRFNVKLVEEGAGPYCGEDDVPHLENIRIESEGTGLTVERSWFVAGSDAGSGHIFTSTTPTGLVLRNNLFEPVNGTYAMQGSVANDAVFAYNTFHQGVALADTDFTWIGNLGVDSPGCGGTHIKNVWQGSGDCAGDVFADDLGLGEGGLLDESSPAIDAAETPGDDDYCTHELGATDRDRRPRPQGSACDAGAAERQDP